MKIVNVYTYDSNPWRFARVISETRCSHTGDTSTTLEFFDGKRKTYVGDPMKAQVVLDVNDSELQQLLDYVQKVKQ